MAVDIKLGHVEVKLSEDGKDWTPPVMAHGVVRGGEQKRVSQATFCGTVHAPAGKTDVIIRILLEGESEVSSEASSLAQRLFDNSISSFSEIFIKWPSVKVNMGQDAVRGTLINVHNISSDFRVIDVVWCK